jgi:methylated-DNA-protein-cysteine methyltransferase-like protein
VVTKKKLRTIRPLPRTTNSCPTRFRGIPTPGGFDAGRNTLLALRGGSALKHGSARSTCRFLWGSVDAMVISSSAIGISRTRGVTALTLIRGVIARIPRGKVTTYGKVAEAAGFPGAARLTVWALQGGEGLPWHRVVDAGGRIALPGEGGREQRVRLEIEGVTFRGGRVRVDLHGWTPRVRRGRRGLRGNAGVRRHPNEFGIGTSVPDWTPRTGPWPPPGGRR